VLPNDPALRGEKHVCALLVVIGADGTLKKLAVANKAPSAFDKAAIAAVEQSQFQPGSRNGTSVPTRLLVWVPFFGDDRPAIPVGGSMIVGKKLKGLTAPIPKNTPAAEFPDAARRAHIDSAVVMFQVLVDEDGKPRVLSLLVRAGSGFDESAFAAVSEYRFKPATLEGVPVPFLMSIEVNFRRAL
jgi:TonB family protein